MRAAGLDYARHEAKFVDREHPSVAAPSDVLFRVHQVGTCGTDRELATFHHGRPPEGEPFLTIGHEALGQVVETGAAVRSLRPGDWVAPMLRRSCQPGCRYCLGQRRDLCITGGYTERGIFGEHGYLCEYAVDREEDLIPVPPSIADVAILTEPLSVVEKALTTALRIHEGGARTALVLGAGPIGVLSALVFQDRGFEVTLWSLEPESHPIPRLLTSAGIRYGNRGERKFDLVFEATGSPAAGFQAMAAMAPLGVCGILGSRDGNGPMPFRNMIVGNQAVFGSVNASPDAFRQAVADLGRLPRAVLQAMIHRVPWLDFPATLDPRAGGTLKLVHVVAE